MTLHTSDAFIGLATWPALTFFTPHETFLPTLLDLCQDRVVIDAGAGAGELSATLQNSGRCKGVIPIDVVYRDDPHVEVMMMNAVTFPYRKGQFVIIARPCRGDWIQATIKAALSRGADVLYITKARHVKVDLSRKFIASGKRLSGKIGAEKEVALLFNSTDSLGWTPFIRE